MNTDRPFPSVPAATEPEEPTAAPFTLEPALRDACRRALGADISLSLMLGFAKAIASLVRTFDKQRQCFGLTAPVPGALIEQIDAVRDLVAEQALDPDQSEASAVRLNKLVASLTKATNLIRPAVSTPPPPPAEILPTHPASVSRWVH